MFVGVADINQTFPRKVGNPCSTLHSMCASMRVGPLVCVCVCVARIARVSMIVTIIDITIEISEQMYAWQGVDPRPFQSTARHAYR